MPDAFFSSGKSKPRKRKRDVSSTKPSSSKPVNGKLKRSRRDEELSETEESDAGNIDDMDLRADEVDPGESGDEDDMETPAEKRLRLAKMVLEERRQELGEKRAQLMLTSFTQFPVAGDEIDAAEIDKELLASRLKQDTVSLYWYARCDIDQTPNEHSCNILVKYPCSSLARYGTSLLRPWIISPLTSHNLARYFLPCISLYAPTTIAGYSCRSLRRRFHSLYWV
jgi:hypothetical protein